MRNQRVQRSGPSMMAERQEGSVREVCKVGGGNGNRESQIAKISLSSSRA